MPMDRKDYPDNWDAIATAIKSAANWTCQECGRPCLKPDEDWMDFVLDLLNSGSRWYDDTFSD